MRKSSREIKKPEFFAFNRQAEGEKFSGEEDQRVEVDSDGEENLFSLPPKNAKRTTKKAQIQSETSVASSTSLFGESQYNYFYG